MKFSLLFMLPLVFAHRKNTKKLAVPLIASMQVLPKVTKIPTWVPRKAVHMGIGSLLISSNIHDESLQKLIYTATFLTAITFPFPKVFSFARNKDLGILGYTLISSVCAHRRIPFKSMGPMFFADPMGAIVGRTLPRRINPVLFGKKTLGGSLAVSIASYVSTDDPKQKLENALFIPYIELLGGPFDNSLIGLYLINQYTKNNHLTLKNAENDNKLEGTL